MSDKLQSVAKVWALLRAGSVGPGSRVSPHPRAFPLSRSPPACLPGRVLAHGPGPCTLLPKPTEDVEQTDQDGLLDREAFVPEAVWVAAGVLPSPHQDDGRWGDMVLFAQTGTCSRKGIKMCWDVPGTTGTPSWGPAFTLTGTLRRRQCDHAP